MSRFGLRKKIKQVLGFVEPPKEQPPSPTLRAPVQPASSKPVASDVIPTSSAPEKTTDESASASKTEQPVSEQDEKILKHRKRTKVAMLKQAVKSNGTAPLGDLHDLAERRYFIAHKAFSDLMEEMVAEGLFLYDWNAGEATITELGAEWIAGEKK